MTFFEKNIQVIKEKNIVLYEQLQIQQERLIDRVMSGTAKDGNSFLEVSIGGEMVALNSTYKPLAEAEKYSRQYAGLTAYARLLIFGFGNGYFARALLAANTLSVQMQGMEASAHVKYAFYEPDAAIFLYAMQTYDLTDILGNADVEVFVEGMNEGQLAAWCINSVDSMNEGSFLLAALPKYKACYQDAFERIAHVYEDTKLRISCDADTKRELSRQIMRNNLFNLKYFQSDVSFQSFKAIYPAGLPMLIVSAGPSLRQSMELLKKLQGKVFVLAVDSAAGYLLEQGILPDGVIAIDPGKELNLFSKEMQDIPFFVHTDVNHLVLDKVEPRHVCFIATNSVYYETLAKERGYRLESLDTGGSVATMALSMAIDMGIENVILMGQDLSVTGEASHVNGQKRLNQQSLMVPGNETDQVPTYMDFHMYLQWFQNTIAVNPQVKVINVTRGGAKIAGALYRHDEELKQEFDFDKAAGLYSIFADAFGKLLTADQQDSGLAAGVVKRIYEQIIENLSALQESICEGEQLAQEAINVIGSGDVSMEIAAEYNQRLNVISEHLTSVLEFEWLESYCRAQEESIFHNLYEKNTDLQTELLEAFDKIRLYYQMLSGNLEAVLEQCRQAAD